ncbi:helix-turn-helix transcriptional regulator [Haloarcula montana]|uniref:helix-turn-helix transcriptional regulator n=1 Tax=Haloarcula montana TaxID=3111776 RepID=UPI002D79FECB|nr:transcriptional regulator FilR1 domain-containing protein [Haloarcula sp. GH36]
MYCRIDVNDDVAMSGQRPIRYVCTSSVREDLVCALGEMSRTTGELLETLDASESAVYDALSNLEEKGLVDSHRDGWRLTGGGQLVADALGRIRDTESLLADDEDYWNDHDTRVLPQVYRCRLPELGDYEILRAHESDLNRQVRQIASRIDAVEACDIVSPVYHEAYGDAMPDHEDARLVLSTDLVEGPSPERHPHSSWESTAVRIADVPFALGVSEEWTILTLPERNGQWARATLVSEDDAAIQWGQDLFETVWADATPPEESHFVD